MTERDRKRWDDCTRMVSLESGASPSERATAQKELDRLKGIYPQGPPKPAPGFTWSYVDDPTYDDAGDAFRYAWGGFTGGASYREPASARAAREAREAEQREQKRQQMVRQQQKRVENVPDWRSVDAMHELYRSTSQWSPEDNGRFKELSRVQWERQPIATATLFARLAVLHGQMLDEYGKQQVAGILNDVAEGRITTGHARWLESRGV